MRTIRAFYRGFFIDLEQDAQKDWRVISIIHCETNHELPPPLVVSPEDVTAELHARAAVDERLANALKDAARRFRLATRDVPLV